MNEFHLFQQKRKERLVYESGKMYFLTLAVLFVLCATIFVTCPIWYIWFGMDFALKIGFSGMIGMLIIVPVRRVLERSLTSIIEDQMDSDQQMGELKRKILHPCMQKLEHLKVIHKDDPAFKKLHLDRLFYCPSINLNDCNIEYMDENGFTCTHCKQKWFN
jgi:hypothetical protein